MVVLDEVEHRQLVGAGEDHGLVDIALAAGAVAEAGQDEFVRAVTLIGAPGRDVALDAHRPADGMQRLGPEHHHVGVHRVVVGVPPAVSGGAEELDELVRADAAVEGHDMFR